ncbi:MAG: hypothetical protein ACOCW2_03420 [Chitinivibrionales bacterium]
MSRTVFLGLIPPVYVIAGVVVPLYLLNPDYGWSIVIAFWVPVVVLSILVLPREQPPMRKAFLATCLLFVPITVGFEYLSLYLDIWNFSEEQSALWGIDIFGAPIEEFIFWFGATPLCLLIYLYYRQLLTGRRG